MDAKLRSYVVMKAVSKIHGRRGKSSLIKLLKGSREHGVENMVHEFDLIDLWGVFYALDMEEIEETLGALTEKGFVFSKDVQSGSYSYPMMHISDEGLQALSVLEESQSDELKAFRAGLWNSRSMPEISDRGMMLDGFLCDLTSFLQMWGDGACSDMELAGLLDMTELKFAERDRLEKFLYHVTPEKLRDSFRTRFTLDTMCRWLTRSIRELLGGISEMEAAIFRCRYRFEDTMYMPAYEVLSYYSLMEKDVQSVLKRIISRFSNRSYTDRFEFIRSVMSFLDSHAGIDPENAEPLVKDTAAVTYELYRQGMTVQDIARVRGLAVSTIYSHFIRLIPQYKIDLDSILPKDRYGCIMQAIDATGVVSLKAIKEALPPDYNYGEIRLVLELQKVANAA